MREIKFRAYYEPRDEIHYNAFQVPFFKDGEFFKFRWAAINSDGKQVALEKDCTTIMQYTGLKDYKNKEIYEGDIVSDGIEKGVVCFDNNYSQFRVSLGEGCSGNIPYSQGGSPKGETQYKVIGNIYEDKDLLDTEDEE